MNRLIWFANLLGCFLSCLSLVTTVRGQEKGGSDKAELREEVDQRHRVLMALLDKEVDKTIDEARRTMTNDPNTAFANLKLAYGIVKSAPELTSEERAHLVNKLMEAGREAKALMPKENRAQESNSPQHQARNPVSGASVSQEQAHLLIATTGPTDSKETTSPNPARAKAAFDKMASIYVASKGNKSPNEEPSQSNSVQQQAQTANDVGAQDANELWRLLRLSRDGTAEISYSYFYNGIINHGTSKFVFTVTPIQLSDDKRSVLTKLMSIRRYWDDDIRGRIPSMPFTDPKGFMDYNTPPMWGDRAKIGDMAWIDVDVLNKGVGEPGTMSNTGKDKKVLAVAGIVAGVAVAAHELSKSDKQAPGESRTESRRSTGHYENKLWDCKWCGGSGQSLTDRLAGKKCLRCGGSGKHVEDVWVAD
jgi:hypothetical protein